MKTGSTFVLLLMIALFMSACGGGKGELLTQRIQYDVSVKSPESDLGWWVQNLEGPKRESLVKSIIASAYEGRVKVYDVMSNKELSASEVKERGTRTELLTLQRPFEPYENYDTLIIRELQLSDISRIRFLEEWYLNENSGKITKKVIAVCPLVESYTETGELRGFQPLFWLSYQRKFPLASR